MTGQLSDRVKNANLFRFIEGGKLICSGTYIEDGKLVCSGALSMGS